MITWGAGSTAPESHGTMGLSGVHMFWRSSFRLPLHTFCRRPITVLLATFFLLAARPGLAEPKTLKVGVYENPPMVFTDKPGEKPQGVFIEVLESIAKANDWTLEYVHGEWSECLDRLEKGEIDLQVDIGKSEERLKRFDYTNEVFFSTWAQIYTKPDSKIDSIEDLNRARIAVMKEDIHFPALKKLMNDFDFTATYLEVGDYDQVTDAVMDGRSDAGLMSRISGLQYEKKRNLRRTSQSLSPIQVFFAFPKGKHADVRDTLDAAVHALKADDNSIYNTSIDKWLSEGKASQISVWWRWTVGVMVALVVLGAVGNRALRTQVRLKTGELEEKNIALELEIGERLRAEEAMRSSELRLRDQNAALSQLAKFDALDQNVREPALKMLTELASKTLSVARASIWLFDEKKVSIECIDLFEQTTGGHSSGSVLTSDLYPSYFRAMQEEHTIAANDARTDPRTREFTDSYLDVIGITSMLDAPIRVGGRMIGVLCHEHIGVQRHWLIDEQNFAGALADFAALILESGERLRAEEYLRRSEEYFRSIIDNALDAVVTMNMEGLIIGWNPEAERTFGWTKKEAIGQILGEFIVPPAYREAHTSGAARYAMSAKKQLNFPTREMSGMHRDGHEFPIELNLTSATVHGENIVTAFIRDITARKRAEEERGKLMAIEQELDVASRIQQSILPRSFPNFEGACHIDIFATMIPAKEVAGDFYDYFVIDKDRLGIVIGDVSGKGVPAAIFMAACRTLLKAIALGGRSPAESLTRLNELLHAENFADMFVTLAYGILDTRTGEVTYTLAGHPLPIVIARDGSVHNAEMVGGTILGVFPSIHYVQTTLRLNPGDALFLYTDGVTEAMDAQGHLFGDARLESYLATAQSGLTMNVLIDQLLLEIDQHADGAPRHDDTTILAIRYKACGS
jgi:PAS domain S-box-containing protein